MPSSVVLRLPGHSWAVTRDPTVIAPVRVPVNQAIRLTLLCVVQAKLRAQGVEVVEFDFLTPDAVADYCYSRGFLQVRLGPYGRVWGPCRQAHGGYAGAHGALQVCMGAMWVSRGVFQFAW